MIEIFGRILPEAVAYMLNPTPIVVLILLLTTAGALRVAVMFLAGWFVSCLAVVLVLLVVGGSWLGDVSTQAEAVGKLCLGVLFAILAVLEWINRPKPGKPDKQAELIKKLDGITPGAGFATGAAMPITNLKNISISAAVVYQLAFFDATVMESIVGIATLIIVGSATLIIPFVIYLVGRERVAPVLHEWRDWLVKNDTAILLVVLCLLSAVSFGEAIEGLS